MDNTSSNCAPVDIPARNTPAGPSGISNGDLNGDLNRSTLFNMEEFKNIYNSFNEKTITRLPEFYRSDVVFKDPLHQINGLQELQLYFSRFSDPNSECSFQFQNVINGYNDAFLAWRMTYQNPALNNGKTLKLDGASMIRFDTHIYYQEDFYDMGAMVYQHLPILGWIIKKINSRLAGT